MIQPLTCTDRHSWENRPMLRIGNILARGVIPVCLGKPTVQLVPVSAGQWFFPAYSRGRGWTSCVIPFRRRFSLGENPAGVGDAFMVGLAGFEPAASCTRDRRSTKLSHSPISERRQ